MFDPILDYFIKMDQKTFNKIGYICLISFLIFIISITIFFGGDNIKSREAYIKADVNVRSELLQQRSTNIDLEKRYQDQIRKEKYYEKIHSRHLH